jgi:hypothetical protein
VVHLQFYVSYFAEDITKQKSKIIKILCREEVFEGLKKTDGKVLVWKLD